AIDGDGVAVVALDLQQRRTRDLVRSLDEVDQQRLRAPELLQRVLAERTLRVDRMRDGRREAELRRIGMQQLELADRALPDVRFDLDVQEQAQAVADVQPAARIVGDEATEQVAARERAQAETLAEDQRS